MTTAQPTDKEPRPARDGGGSAAGLVNDPAKAAAVIVLGALAFLALTGRSFGSVIVPE